MDQRLFGRGVENYFRQKAVNSTIDSGINMGSRARTMQMETRARGSQTMQMEV